MRGLTFLTLTFFFLFNQKSFAYCEHDNKSHAPKPISEWKSWSAVPDELVLQAVDTHATGSLNYKDLKVLVWNLEKGEVEGLYSDLDKLSKNVDLVLMQEAYLDKKFEDLACARTDLNWAMAASFWDYYDTMTGVATASKQPPLNAKFIRSPDRENLIDTPKMMLISEYVIPERTEKLLVINIHGINFVGDAPFERQVQLAVDEIAKHRGPVIFAGDFNARNNDRMNYLKKVLSPYGVIHADVDYQGQSEWGLLPFDHLYQRGFDVIYTAENMSINTSDHKPLYFELKLR